MLIKWKIGDKNRRSSYGDKANYNSGYLVIEMETTVADNRNLIKVIGLQAVLDKPCLFKRGILFGKYIFEVSSTYQKQINL